MDSFSDVNKKARAAAAMQLVSDPDLTGYQAVSAAENAAVMENMQGRDYVIYVSSFLHATLKTHTKLTDPAETAHKAPKMHTSKTKSGEPSRADQIRTLAKTGMSKGQIAKELGIKYQYVWQILSKEETVTSPEKDQDITPELETVQV